MTKTPDSVVRSFIDQHQADFLQDLADWLSIPSVSADPGRSGDVRRSAEWLAAKLGETGFPVAEVWESDGLPAVFAEWPSGTPARRPSSSTATTTSSRPPGGGWRHRAVRTP